MMRPVDFPSAGLYGIEKQGVRLDTVESFEYFLVGLCTAAPS
jgi:hypothetical protein